jgi:hypothetical protein
VSVSVVSPQESTVTGNRMRGGNRQGLRNRAGTGNNMGGAGQGLGMGGAGHGLGGGAGDSGLGGGAGDSGLGGRTR